MPSLASFSTNQFVKAIIVSKPKVGKTVGAATFPRANFISFDEEGLTSLVNPAMEEKYGFSKKGILYEIFTDEYDAKGVVKRHAALDNACRYFDACMSTKSTKWKSLVGGAESIVSQDMFDTWVIDSGTTLVRSASNKAIILAGTNAVPGLASNTWNSAKSSGIVHLKLQDMGAERSMTEQFIRMVRETSKHVLVLCHEREIWEGEGNNQQLVAITPLFTGQSVEKVPADFNEVWWVEAKPNGPKIERVLQTQPKSKRVAGTRLGVPDGTLYEWEAIASKLPSGKAQVPA